MEDLPDRCRGVEGGAARAGAGERGPSPPRTALGVALRRRRAGRTGIEVASDLEIDHDHYYRLERGTHRPSYDTAVKLAAWLGWTTDQVMQAAATAVGPGT